MPGPMNPPLLLDRVAGADVRKLAAEFGTPVYVYDAELIERRIADLAGFPKVRFAQKANSNLSVLALMRRRGVVVDAVSAGEIHRALAAGFRAEDVVYTADLFDRPTLELVCRLGIHVNCGSADMLAQYGALKPGGSATLRINPGFGHGHSQKTNTGGEGSKHGIWHEDLPATLALAARSQVKVTGLHLHIGSGTDLAHLQTVCAATERLAAEIGPSLTTISAGGGLPTPYRPTDEALDMPAFTKMWRATRDAIAAKLGHPIELEVEPGRYLVAEAGFLICEVRAVKSQGALRYVLVNAGFQNLARPAMYGSYHPISLCRQNPADADAAIEPVVVAGPLCESGDVFTQREGGFVETRDLPRAKVGDLLVIHCAGAYGFTMSSNYNSMPLLPEVLVRRGVAKLVRARQTPEDLVRGESVVEF